mmetsp:Transcript_5964/g.5256  ORF Transcript_5964/g.5256 Transcript_5964/m.5256 type:complete len:82 (-) Transcript_5964:518-763(-)
MPITNSSPFYKILFRDTSKIHFFLEKVFTDNIVIIFEVVEGSWFKAGRAGLFNIFIPFNKDIYGALLSEFYCIADEVHQNL